MSVSAALHIGEYLERHQRACNDALGRVKQLVPNMGRVADAMRYAIDGDGKRLRPALCAAAYEALAGQPAPDAVADLGAAIELIHTYSLVHDDLPCMDDDDVRRDRPTTHRVFGSEAAMLAGVALIPLAFRVAADASEALGLDAETARAILTAMSEAAGAAGMVGGQVRDLEGESIVADITHLEGIHAAKTGALLRGACRIGALAAKGSAEQLAAIDEYGRHLGLAFQIADDVLDETASTEQLGKTAGKDREAAKATFPLVLGLAGAMERAAAEAAGAVQSLESAGISTDWLGQLARFAVERKR